MVQHPESLRDYVAATVVTMDNTQNWFRKFRILRWLRQSRLVYAHHESTFKLLRSAVKTREIMPQAIEKVNLILEKEFSEHGIRKGGTGITVTLAPFGELCSASV